MTEQKIGKYSLIRQIATGGMAEIWLAEQRGPGGFNKELVIKKILPHLAEETQMTQMFLDEARLVAELSHPNIGQVFDLGEHNGDYYIAMEFIDGLDLAKLSKKIKSQGTQMPVEYAARIICDVLAALDYAHEYVNREGEHVGLVHRDISPHNVLLSNDGAVKLVDFGVAKATGNSHKTETGAVKGKFAYMAPEQIESKELDRRVDIFAVGVLFFELLAGTKPFGEDLKAVSEILAGNVPDLRLVRDDVPERVVQIIERALARDRDERFQTAAEMESALQDFLQQEKMLVPTRDLSVMVRQLQNLGAAGTQQLFGFQKQGVDKKKPRITLKDVESSSELEVLTAERLGAATPDLSEQPRDRELTVPEVPSVKAGGKRHTLAMEAAREGMSLRLIFGFIGLMFLLVAAAGIVAFLFISRADDEVADSLEQVELVVEQEPVAAEPSPASWRHADGLVVSITTNKPAELYRSDRKVGTTPFQTSLRPGTYFVELRADGERRSVEFVVVEDNPIQRFRFDL